MTRFTEDALRAFLDSPGGLSRFWQPAADIHETRDGLLIKLEMAGVTTETLSVTLSGDGRQLTISGSRAEPEPERRPRIGCHQLEIYYGPFERTFELPDELAVDRDGITATLKNGFLSIFLPHQRREPQITRTIPIERE